MLRKTVSVRQTREVGIGEDHIRGVNGHVSAVSHSDAHIRERNRRAVVDAVADKHHTVSIVAQTGNDRGFLIGQQATDRAVETEFCRHEIDSTLIVS